MAANDTDEDEYGHGECGDADEGHYGGGVYGDADDEED